MNLDDLIKQGLLEELGDTSIKQIRNRFEKGKKHLVFAKENFKISKKYNEIIYTNIYSAARVVAEAYLLLNGYRAKIKDHHKTVLRVSKLLMKDGEMEAIFTRLNKMRKNRNTMEYDMETIGISETAIKTAIKDVEKFTSKIEELISKKDTQKKLL